MNFKLSIPLLLLASVSFAQVEFFDGSYDQLKNKAKGYKKNYFVDFYTDWCGYCKKMDATTFQNPEIGKTVNNGFIAYKLNAEKDGIALAQELKVSGFPTVAFFNYKGELIGLHPGYQSAGQFMLLLDKYKSESSGAFLASFFDVNRNYIDQFQIKTFNKLEPFLKNAIQSASSFGLENNAFAWEEYVLDEGLSSLEELRASTYFYLNVKEWSKVEKNINLLMVDDKIDHEELAYFICLFVENKKVELTQVKWANELVYLEENSFYQELRIATLYAFGDVDDALSSYDELEKYNKKNKIDRQKSMAVFKDLLK